MRPRHIPLWKELTEEECDEYLVLLQLARAYFADLANAESAKKNKLPYVLTVAEPNWMRSEMIAMKAWRML